MILKTYREINKISGSQKYNGLTLINRLQTSGVTRFEKGVKSGGQK